MKHPLMIKKSMLLFVKNRFEAGFVLVSALILMQLIVMLSLYLLRLGLSVYQEAHMGWQHYAFFNDAENKLNQIIQQGESELDRCEIQKVYDLRSQSIVWWKSHACCEKNYCYVVESLSSHACFVKDGISIPFKHLRYTLFAFHTTKVYREWLQSVVIKLDNANKDCLEMYPNIALGQQSWRRL